MGNNCTFSASSGVDTPALTLDTLNECVRKMNEIAEKPYRKLLSDNGFDPDKDMVVFSEELAQEIGLDVSRVPPTMKNRVKFSKYATGIVLIKNTLPFGPMRP